MVKVHTLKDAQVLRDKFIFLAKKFKIKIKVLIRKTDEPAGRGIGPVLEMRDSLRVLQQKTDRPLDLEIRSIHLAGNLLDLCIKDSSEKFQKDIKKNYGNGFGLATAILQSGQAFEKFKEIVIAQGGSKNIDSEKLKTGKYTYTARAEKNGEVKGLNSRNITAVARILGAPMQKSAGIYFKKMLNDKIKKGEILYTIYSENMYNLEEGRNSLQNFPILDY
jgi:thymidine phosphorylase